MTSVRITNILDTHVGEDAPNTNYNLGGSMYIRNWAGANGRLGYMFFSRPFPLGATITSAKLHFYAYAKPVSGAITLYLRMLNQSVPYTKVTWNTRPTALLTAIAERTSVKAGTYPDREEYEFDITAHMNAISDGTKWFGWQIRTDWTSTGYSPRFMAANHPDPNLRPWVEITWSDKPDQPTQLSPSGNRFVSNDQPILRFDYTDVSGDTDLAQVRVQIDNATDFVSPLYDSMDSPVETPQWDLTGSAFTAAADTTYYWRVMVQDGAGLWSTWSAAAPFRYHELPTVDIDNPALPPDNFVEEPTPPITWTVTDGDQESYSLDLYIRTGTTGWASRFHRGRTVSAVTDGFVVPAGVLTVKAATYLIDIRVWDDLDREAVPNGQVYRLRSRQFTYQFSADTTPVTDLTAEPMDPYPGITLAWERAAMPDSYSIIRDGRVIAAGLDPDELHGAGTSYSWADRWPIKRRDHVYSVQAVVNGKAADDSPEVTAANYLLGTWLVGVADPGWQVCIVNDKGRTFEFSEDSATYEVLGATTKALVTQTLRGYSGEVSGEMFAQIGNTSESAGTWRNHLLELKATPGQLVYLFITDMTIPVVLQNVQVFPSVRPVRSYLMTAEWHQQGNLPFDPKGLL